MHSKLRIKLGQVEFEYEGEAEFSQESIKDLFSHMEALFSTAIARGLEPTPSPTGDGGENGPSSGAGDPAINLHPNTIASRLGVSSGPDLALAAAAYLQLSLGKPSFTRKELLDEMKSATTYYKQTMSGNLTSIIETHIKASKFNQIGQNVYSLHATELQSLREKLA
jgi:hypothetical protein